MNLVAKSQQLLKTEVLPPTERDARYHCLRVYLQVMRWKNLNSTLDPEKWGWYLENNHLLPIMTDMAPTQPDLLKVIRCRCKSSQCNSCLLVQTK